MSKKTIIILLSVGAFIVILFMGIICGVVFYLMNRQTVLPPGPTITVTATPTISPHTTGLSYETAIVVPETTESTGIAWEYRWLRANACQNNLGYSKPTAQALDSKNGHDYDILTAVCKDGTKIDYYFLIDNFFGKN